jgi:wobble nucleotide-excising tRNase
MLERIQNIHNIGLFQNDHPGQAEFKKVTLIYSENGRGKTTLSSLLSSLSSGATDILKSRHTVDAEKEQYAELQFNDGTAKYNNSSWSSTKPQLKVFNDDFINKNVYSGIEAGAHQRQQLFRLILGEEGIKEYEKVSALKTDLSKKKRTVSDLETELTSKFETFNIQSVIDLELPDDYQVQQQVLEQQIADSQQASVLLKTQPIPFLEIPDFDVKRFKAVLQSSLSSAEHDAQSMLEQQLSKQKQNTESYRRWIREGINYTDLQALGECPFCGQNIQGLSLIESYQTYFNAAFDELQQSLTQELDIVNIFLQSNILHSLELQSQSSQQSFLSWNSHIELAPIDFQINVSQQINQCESIITTLVNKKKGSPLESIGEDSEYAMLTHTFQEITQLIRGQNSKISTANTVIQQYQTSLGNSNLQSLRGRRHDLELKKLRQEKEYEDKITLWQALTEEVHNLTNTIQNKSEEITQKTNSIFDQFADSINRVLEQFGASFSISKIESKFTNANVQSNYSIILRGQSIPVNNKVDGPSFNTALSDGDKRTLAFAFFIASLKTQATISNNILVIDDPMTSMDSNRRQSTIQLICELSKSVEQIVVLSHDHYFLHDLSGSFQKPASGAGKTDIQILKINWTKDSYSRLTLFVENNNQDQIGAFDHFCESTYAKDLRKIEGFLSSEPGYDTENISEALRKVLDGFLHRMYPLSIKPRLMLGQIGL